MGGFEIKKRKPVAVIYDSEMVVFGDGSPLSAAILRRRGRFVETASVKVREYLRSKVCIRARKPNCQLVNHVTRFASLDL